MGVRFTLFGAQQRNDQSLATADSLSGLYARYRPKLVRFLRDTLGLNQDAEECVQEVFVRLTAQFNQQSFIEAHRVRAWLFGAARLVALERYRDRLSKMEPLEDEESSIRCVLGAPNPETAVLTREVEEHISEAMMELTMVQRTVFVLRVDHGLSYDEIAEVAQLTLPQVKNELHRARMKMREHLVDVVGK